MNISKCRNRRYTFSGKILCVVISAIFVFSGYATLANQSLHINRSDTTGANGVAETFQEIGFFGPVKENKWDSFVQAVQHNIENSRKEPGNLLFSMFQPESGELQPIWFEKFVSKQAHQHHKQQGYFNEAIRVIQESLLGPAESIELKEVEEVPAIHIDNLSNSETSRYVIVLFHLLPDKSELFKQAIAEAAVITRLTQGNLELNLYQYLDEPNKFVLIEGWESADDHEAQLKMKHIKKLNDATEGFFVSSPMDTRWLLKDISH